MKNVIKKEIDWEGKKLTLETGRLAKLANAAVIGRIGDTVVLATVVSSDPKEDVDYFPLSVDYEERLYAAGRISTSRFIKREGRPSEEAILNGRLIDRSIRPLFPKDYRNEVQVILTVLSYDNENDPDIVGLVSASAALSISDIPWKGPIAGLRVGFRDGEYLFNPDNSDLEFTDLDLIVSSSEDRVVMLEAGANQVKEEDIIKGITLAHQKAQPIIKLIREFAKEVGKEKAAYEVKTLDELIKNEIIDFIKDHFKEKLFNPDKAAREDASDEFKEEMFKVFEGKLSKTDMGMLFEDTIKKMVRAAIVDDKKRPDGRKIDEVREIEVEVGLLPRAHGSAVFRRGDTQVLSVATLGSTSLEQLIEGMEGEGTKRYMHHYIFPPYSTGEVRRVGSPGRREIGHGRLAEKALERIIPNQDKFPYTIRLVSEVMSSSGSTSMGSACGSTLALMDAGVPITTPISGIAMGLVTEGDKYEILTDIQALEDFYGDMDFKVAGSQDGVTAIQMDTKIAGLTMEMIEKTFAMAKVGRNHILDRMLTAIPEHRKEISKYAPRVTVLNIPPKKIGEVIGSGGKTINSIIDNSKMNKDTVIDINIEDDGKVTITSNSEESAKKAASMIEGLTKEVQPGEVYDGLVKRVMPFGAFVEILPGKEGMVHVSQLADQRVNDINTEVKVGDKFRVKVIEVDNQGRINLSKKQAQKKD